MSRPCPGGGGGGGAGKAEIADAPVADRFGCGAAIGVLGRFAVATAAAGGATGATNEAGACWGWVAGAGVTAAGATNDAGAN